MGFTGSEDYIRLQFEEYILSMVSSVKYHLFLEKHAGSESNLLLPDIGKFHGMFLNLGIGVLTSLRW